MSVYQQQIRIQGVVQGVGFRPFVARLASRLNLTGQVANDGADVVCLLEGSKSQLTAFRSRILDEAPSPSRISRISVEHDAQANTAHNCFSIAPSRHSDSPNGALPVDQAMCEECRSELLDPKSRRFSYPFISCSTCGPRYAITESLPFDRQSTSMSDFALCPTCQDEFCDPEDRRHHAQTISCPECGPGLKLLDGNGNQTQCEDIFEEIAHILHSGGIVAIKSTGGFHLACSANQPDALKKLRRLKGRPDKPFALMANDWQSSNTGLELDEKSIDLLTSPAAPIVLVPQPQSFAADYPEIAKYCSDIGCMIPYNAIYALLFKALGRSATRNSNLGSGPRSDPVSGRLPENACVLVVTSANEKDQTLIACEEECIQTFRGKIDAFLSHNLDIVNPVDDSVVQAGNNPLTIRIGRGLAPLTLNLDSTNNPDCQALAFGAHLKATTAIAKGNTIQLSPYIGDLDTPVYTRRYLDHVEHQLKTSHSNAHKNLFVCDLHPDYFSTRTASDQARTHHVRFKQVQHHHAHLAAVIAEHSLQMPCLGLALDGFGLGPSGQAWGGELLSLERDTFRQVGSLSNLVLPGGSLSSRYPLRPAASVLVQLNHPNLPEFLVKHPELKDYLSLLKHQGGNTTSSMGRWFDAVAGLLGFKEVMSFEGQAAMYVEYLASQCSTPMQAIGLAEITREQCNLYPVIEHCLEECSKRAAALRFHLELADGLSRWIAEVAENNQISTLIASGGCLQNRVLREHLSAGVRKRGFELHLPESVPANDSGIAVGQAYLAHYQLATMRND